MRSIAKRLRAMFTGGDIVECVFRCSLCGKVAATITLIPPNVRHADVLQPGVATLVIADFIGRSREQVGGAQEEPLRAALKEKNAAALYELQHLWAPFYCPQCQRSYCIHHWTVVDNFDEDFPGFYDSTTGTCPEGHRRKVDD
jgi:hypothetical protein